MPRAKVVTVHDRMQRGYRYALSEPIGRNFAPDFKPDLTPKEMLALGVFGGKYMTDCRKEFPAAWFTRAKLSPSGRDPELNYFGIEASQKLSEWRRKGLDPSGRSARLVSVVLPLLYGSQNACRRRAPDRALEGDEEARRPDPAALRAGRPDVPPAAATGSAALGLRQPETVSATSPTGGVLVQLRIESLEGGCYRSGGFGAVRHGRGQVGCGRGPMPSSALTTKGNTA
jgi:hypothetical protein